MGAFMLRCVCFSVIGTALNREEGLAVADFAGSQKAGTSALMAALEAADAMCEIVAPKIGGATLSDGTLIPAQQKIDGGPSVLYDAVAIIASAQGAAMLAMDAPAKDFVTDAFAHCKFIGLSAETEPLLVKAGIAEDLDDGCLAITSKADAQAFVEALAPLRFWARESQVDLDAMNG